MVTDSIVTYLSIKDSEDDFSVIKLNSVGDIEWEKQIQDTNPLFHNLVLNPPLN